jgi:hypothetical protein
MSWFYNLTWKLKWQCRRVVKLSHVYDCFRWMMKMVRWKFLKQVSFFVINILIYWYKFILLQSGNTSFTIENSGTNTPFSKSASVLGVSESLVVPPKLRKTRNVYIPPTVLWQFFGLIPAVTDSREQQIKCNHCSWSITFTGSTSGASYHLKRCVPSQMLWEALIDCKNLTIFFFR